MLIIIHLVNTFYDSAVFEVSSSFSHTELRNVIIIIIIIIYSSSLLVSNAFEFYDPVYK
jgi:hypothetical protein